MNDKVKLDWKVIFRYGLILLIIAVVCTLLLAVTNMVTAPVIAERSIQANIEAQKSVMPDADNFVTVDESDLEEIREISQEGDVIDSVDFAYKDDVLIGYTVKTLPNGYGGEIELLTGINTDGIVTGIYILEQSETAGLGARSTEKDFQKQYEGLNAEEEVYVEKSGEIDGNEIQAISGATITSKAVTLGVNISGKAVVAAEALNE